ncbi:hypothetical protein GCM10028778_13250 [Barrientosiimonas marina]
MGNNCQGVLVYRGIVIVELLILSKQANLTINFKPLELCLAMFIKYFLNKINKLFSIACNNLVPFSVLPGEETN